MNPRHMNLLHLGSLFALQHMVLSARIARAIDRPLGLELKPMPLDEGIHLKSPKTVLVVGSGFGKSTTSLHALVEERLRAQGNVVLVTPMSKYDLQEATKKTQLQKHFSPLESLQKNHHKYKGGKRRK